MQVSDQGCAYKMLRLVDDRELSLPSLVHLESVHAIGDFDLLILLFMAMR